MELYSMQTKKHLMDSTSNMADWIEAKGILDRWSKLKNTEELQRLTSLFISMTFYTNRLEGDVAVSENIYNNLKKEIRKTQAEVDDLHIRQVELLDEVNTLKRKLELYE